MEDLWRALLVDPAASETPLLAIFPLAFLNGVGLIDHLVGTTQDSEKLPIRDPYMGLLEGNPMAVRARQTHDRTGHADSLFHITIKVLMGPTRGCACLTDKDVEGLVIQHLPLMSKR